MDDSELSLEEPHRETTKILQADGTDLKNSVTSKRSHTEEDMMQSNNRKTHQSSEVNDSMTYDKQSSFNTYRVQGIGKQ